MQVANTPRTLPDWLREQARSRSTAVALRHKRLGVWEQWRWQELAAQTAKLMAALAQQGFGPGQRLVLLTRPRSQALVATLAAQALGGIAAPLDTEQSGESLDTLLAFLQADYVFAEAHGEVERVLRVHPPQLLVYADARGLRAAQAPSLVAYDSLIESGCGLVDFVARAEQDAFVFHRIGDGGCVESHRLRHGELIAEAAHLLHKEQLGPPDQALAARAFAAVGQARYLLAPWLVGGFALNFPESLETRDRDRRELAPTLVAGTGETYDRIAEMTFARLPPPGSLSRRLVDWSLSPQRAGLGRLLAWWLVRRPLREVLGYARTRTPLVIGASPSPATRGLFKAIGLTLRHWPEANEWRNAAPPAAVAPAQPAPINPLNAGLPA